MSRPATSRGPRIIIACEVMRPELEAIDSKELDVEFDFQEQNLHRTPELMGGVLQRAIDTAAPRTKEPIVLGYGLCSNGTVGLKAPEQGMVIPLVHDCISLFLGSREAYDKAFNARCGTYYLTPGWVSTGKDPLGVLEEDYVPRVGREDAEWALHEELKHYTHITLIDTGTGDIEALRARALENTRFLNKEYAEVRGTGAFFEKMVCGPYDDGDFLVVEPGRTVVQDTFL